MDKERIYGLDLIRIIAFLAIIVFHCSWAVWLNPSGPPEPPPTLILQIAEFYARVFSFSGFTIIFLTSFLMGFKAEKYRKHVWLPYFLLGGWIIFCFCTYLKEKEFTLGWDIYPLVGLGLISGKYLLRQKKSVQNIFLVFSVALLLFPVWEIPHLKNLPFYFREVLVGQCPEDYADWPICPWIGLFWLGFISGTRVREQAEKGWDALRFRKFEWPLGILVLVYFWQFKTSYFFTPLGDGWSCFTFRQEPHVFWAHMLFWMGLIRVSFHPTVQKTLRENSFARAVSSLRINRHFFLAYFLHYLVLFALLGFLDPKQSASEPWVLNSVFLLVFPLTELATRAFRR